jgi:hypothetical protein
VGRPASVPGVWHLAAVVAIVRIVPRTTLGPPNGGSAEPLHGVRVPVLMVGILADTPGFYVSFFLKSDSFGLLGSLHLWPYLVNHHCQGLPADKPISPPHILYEARQVSGRTWVTHQFNFWGHKSINNARHTRAIYARRTSRPKTDFARYAHNPMPPSRAGHKIAHSGRAGITRVL